MNRFLGLYRFNLGSLLVLLAALGLIACALIYLILAFQQPSDGWFYQTRLDGEFIAQAPLVNWTSPIQPGDILQGIDGQPVNGALYHPLVKSAGWQNGGTAQYSVTRAGQQISLTVPLGQRSLFSLTRFYQENNNFILTIILWYLIGFGIFFLRPRDSAARLLLLFTTYWNTINAFIQADTSPALYFYPPGLFAVSIFLNSLWLLMFALIIHFALVFPVKKWPMSLHPKPTQALLYGIPTASTFLAVGAGQIEILNMVLILMVLLVILTLIATTVHNLRFLRDPVTQAQVRWVILGIGAPIGAALISFLLQSLFPDLDNRIFSLLWSLSALLLPVCFGIAITRYRLFDIDLIIRRTLQYGLLTLLLGLVYFGSVVLLRQIFQAITGQSQPAEIVISTLVIAALFNPLRLRIQRWIDRRFFRQKYDVTQALENFSTAARRDVALEHLTANLEKVLQQTVQPQQVSVWIRVLKIKPLEEK